MIKFALRRNLIYVLQYIIWSFVRNLIIMFMNALFKFGKSYIFTQFMFIGEILAGIIMFFSQRKYNQKKRKENKEEYFMSIKLIKTEEDEDDYFVPMDNKAKILFLIFFISFLDVAQFTICHIHLPRFFNISKSLCSRLFGFTTIFSLFFYVYALKLPVYKHHIFSLLIIGICLIAIIASEFYFQIFDIYTSYKSLIITFIYIILSQILSSSGYSIEKYLFEYDYMNPFVVLMYEGLFGFFISFLNLIDENYFHDFVDIYKDKDSKEFALFIFLLIVFIILSGGKNLFRIVTTKIYSPMVTTLLDYVLNPIYLIYYYGAQGDFKKEDGKLDVAYFTINIIISLIISFFGCVYNEFIILFFCGLERNTHDQVSKRASSKIDENLTELMKFDESTEMSMNDETNSVIK